MKKVFALLLVMCLSGCTIRSEAEIKQDIQYYLEEADKYYSQNRYDDGDISLSRAELLAREQFGDNSKQYADILLLRGEKQRIYRSAMPNLNKAESIYKELNDIEGLAKVYYQYGKLHVNIDENANALNFYKRALEYSGNSETRLYELEYNIYVGIGVATEDRSKSLEYYKTAETLLGHLNSELQVSEGVNLYNNFGVCYYCLNEYTLAIDFYERAINLAVENDYNNDALLAAVYDYCGYCYVIEGECQKGLEYLYKAVDLNESNPDSTLWDKAVVYRHLSDCYLADDILDYDKVLEYGLKSCEIFEAEAVLDASQLERYKLLKDAFQDLYNDTPQAQTQDFESWYQENISRGH